MAAGERTPSGEDSGVRVVLPSRGWATRWSLVGLFCSDIDVEDVVEVIAGGV